MKIGLVHLDYHFPSIGGSEAVSMHILESIPDEFEVEVYSLTEPDIPKLNDFFGTNVAESTTVNTPKKVSPLIYSIQDLLSRFSSQDTKVRLTPLRMAILTRFVRQQESDLDLVISTFNEGCFTTPSIQYIHFPTDYTVHPSAPSHVKLYRRICRRIGSFDVHVLQSSRIISNSQYISNKVKEMYGIESEVLHPPVRIEPFDINQKKWSNRENGFVMVGRISPGKEIEKAIRIIDSASDEVPDLHLHIIGPIQSQDYGDQIREKISNKENIFLEGPVDREELIECICTHRYGIHANTEEHFGMVIAEMLAAGSLPFVPATGGPPEIVKNCSKLQYYTEEEAVDNIIQVASNTALQKEIRQEFTDVKARFGPKRFKDRIQSLVHSEVSKQF